MSRDPLRLTSAEALEALGARLAGALHAGDILLLEGGLGAGKTTLVRGLLRALGHDDDVPSPTFAILQGYEPPDVRLPLAHVDLYRLDSPEETAELGLDDWLVDGALAVEWPDRLGGRFDDDALILRIDVAADGARLLTARVPDAWEGRWPLP